MMERQTLTTGTFSLIYFPREVDLMACTSVRFLFILSGIVYIRLQTAESMIPCKPIGLSYKPTRLRSQILCEYNDANEIRKKIGNEPQTFTYFRFIYAYCICIHTYATQRNKSLEVNLYMAY